MQFHRLKIFALSLMEAEEFMENTMYFVSLVFVLIIPPGEGMCRCFLSQITSKQANIKLNN
jgi:hypothetical protein